MAEPHIVIFVDTNVYLHFEFFTEVPWPSLVDADEVLLVVPPVTANELDKHKYAGASKIIKTRADKVVKRLYKIHSSAGEVRPGVKLLLSTERPREEFEAYDLDRGSQDDHLLASILQYRDKHLGEHIMLVTDDLGNLTRAPNYAIEVRGMPEKYRTAAEPDPSEKKIRELEQQLRELQSRIPKLRLQFPAGTDALTFTPAHSRMSSPGFVEERMEKLRRKYPKIEKSDAPPERKGQLDISELLANPERVRLSAKHSSERIPAREIEKYNEALETFYANYEQYLNRLVELDGLRARTIQLNIQMENDGTSTAEDVGVFIRLPSDLKVTASGKRFKKPEEPK